MDALLIIRTRNGFALMPYDGEVPQTGLDELQVATTLGYGGSGSDSVTDQVVEHFREKPKAAPDVFPGTLPAVAHEPADEAGPL